MSELISLLAIISKCSIPSVFYFLIPWTLHSCLFILITRDLSTLSTIMERSNYLTTFFVGWRLNCGSRPFEFNQGQGEIQIYKNGSDSGSNPRRTRSGMRFFRCFDSPRGRRCNSSKNLFSKCFSILSSSTHRNTESPNPIVLLTKDHTVPQMPGPSQRP